MERSSLEIADVQVFLAVAAARSVSGAARQLRLPKSTVSRHLSRLETGLGVALLSRSARSVDLTEYGVVFRRHGERLVAEFEAAREALQDHSAIPRGMLRVNAPAATAQLLLAPLLPGFLQDYPSVRVTLDIEGHADGAAYGAADVIIRLGPPSDPQAVMRKLGVAEMQLHASPKYLAARGTPKTSKDLAGHDIVDIAAIDGRRTWSFQGAGGPASVVVTPRLIVGDAMSIKVALVHGAGLSWLPTFLTRQEVKAGLLVTVHLNQKRPAQEIYAVYPPEKRRASPKVRAFIDYLAAHFVVETSSRQTRAK
jgi:DNA-binding transcriptional LysR family regulator